MKVITFQTAINFCIAVAFYIDVSTEIRLWKTVVQNSAYFITLTFLSNPYTISLKLYTLFIDQNVVYNKNRFKVSLNPSKDSNYSNILNIEVTFHNVGVGVTVQNLLFQTAIPKTQKLQMQPHSSTDILSSATAQQTIHVANPQKSNVRL
ncbi:19554_t:CDS:2 [Gigaspora margarita]|uniref:19554_t:CDS:1 n=1 Tax=Gigaspora margarita TaxID=4874 RepID=A0ABN7UND6_GIGMA|nr:19554_t:CDS:2 [Gigaspora margarita]